MRIARRLKVVVILVLLLWAAAGSANFLIIDDPQKSDAILVLAGETEHRPARALELLDRGYARQVVFDVPADAKVYGSTDLQLAQNWASKQPQSRALIVCPTQSHSTKAETEFAVECLRKVDARTVLLVTSDFHTRRALSIFRKEVPEITFHVAAAYDPAEFGVQWWRHRQWAKTNLGEWVRLLWWELVDRWF